MILYSRWLSLPLAVRNDIANRFGIAKSGPTHVANNEVVSDGYKVVDVENALNVEAIKTYLGVDQTDLVTLFDLLVSNLHGIPTVLSGIAEVTPSPTGVVEIYSPAPEVPKAEKPKKGRVLTVTRKPRKTKK